MWRSFKSGNGIAEGESVLPINIVHSRMYLQKDSTNKIDPRLQEQGGQLCNKEVHDNEAAAIVERRLSMIAISFNFL